MVNIHNFQRPPCVFIHDDTMSRSIMHDPEAYPQPEEFRPERFLKADGQLDPEVRDPAVAVFGFGRR